MNTVSPPRRALGAFADAKAAISGMANQRFWRQTALLFVAIGVLNGSNYAFHVVVSRLLGPSRYGALASLLAVVMVLSVPFGVLQTVIAQKAAALRARDREDEVAALAAGIVKTLTPIALLAGLVILIGAPLLSFFLHLGFLPAALLAPYVVLSILSAVPLGVLQGELRFGAIAGLLLVGVALRLATGITLVALGGGVGAAVGATSLAAALVLPLGLRLVGVGRQAWNHARSGLGYLRGDFAAATLGLTSFWLLAEVDVGLARHYLGHEEAGFYSSAGLLARALLFLPAAVSIAAFPRFVSARERGEGQRRWLRLSAGAVAAMVAIAAPVLIGLRAPLVQAAFGSRFAPAGHLLLILTPAMAMLALANLLVYFHIAMGSRAYTVVLSAAAAEAGLIAIWHSSGEEIAWIVAGVSAFVALFLYQAARSLSRWQPPLQRAEGLPSLSSAPSLELSLVLPCHNAGAGVRSVLASLTHHLKQVEGYEIIVVSDGSTDDTVAMAETFESDRVRVLHYPRRSGKGNALHVGLTEARGAYVAFIDADGDIAPDAIAPFLALMKLYEPDVVLGSKRHPLSEVYYPPLRRLLSWTYHKVTRILFRVKVRDTQTGLKLFRREVLADVLPRLLEKRYAFDLEFLVVARSLGYRRVFEAPVTIDYRFASHVGPEAAFRILVDTLAIFYRHYVLDTYRQAGQRPHGTVPPGVTPLTGTARSEARPAGSRRAAAMRILLLNWRDVRNPASGGAEIFTHEVAKRWVAAGHDVTLLTSRFAGASSHEEIDGVRIRRIGRLRSGTFHASVQRELARVHGFDAVVDGINTIPFLTPLWQRRLPPTIALVFQLAEEVWDFELPKPLATAGRWLEPRMLRPYRDFPVVTISESGRNELERLGLRHVSVVEPGRDEPPPLDHLAKETAPTFLFVGRLAANKRPDHALAAFRAIHAQRPDARLWIVGRGAMDRELRGADLTGVELLGFLPRSEMYERMARAHCLLVPSVREGWGLVVIESNSVATPAVGYDVPGIRDSIRDGITGRLVEPGDTASLAAAASGLVEDDAYLDFQKAAVDWAGTFSWDATAARLLAQFDVQPGEGAVEDSARLADPATMATAAR